MYELYERLKAEKGVTDYQVAKATGTATATLTAWKQGIYTPKIDKIKRIADYFEVPIDEFLKESEKV